MTTQNISKAVVSLKEILSQSREDFKTGRAKFVSIKLELSSDEVRLKERFTKMSNGNLSVGVPKECQIMADGDFSLWCNRIEELIHRLYSGDANCRPKFLELIFYPDRVQIFEKKEYQWATSAKDKSNNTIRLVR